MSRRTMLLLAAGVIAGGCSRDGPIAAPQVETEAATSARQVGPEDASGARSPATAAPAGDPTADAVDDALGRLLPALGEHGTGLRSRLLAMKANRSDKAVLDDLRRVLNLLASTIPAAYRSDLDALRLELGAVTN